MTEQQRTNAEWAAIQIQKHGVDRYPSIHEQFIKLVDEVGELGKEINAAYQHGLTDRLKKRIKNESADVALALYNLSAKVGFYLDDAIKSKVERDDRTF